jgi:glutamate racemase
MNSAPLGVFDSGSGGLSIVNSLQSQLPHESIVYVGDHAHNPYGDKSQEFIRDRVVHIIEYLISQKAKLIIAACNTATIAGIEYYREKFPNIPIVGVVPVVKTAAVLSKAKSFVVLSTDFTAKSQYQKNLIDKWANDCMVINVGSSRLVPLIEEGKITGPQIEEEVKKIFASIQDASFDVVALGCTHFPFIVDTIQKIVGPKIQILDSSDAVTRQVERILQERNIQSEESAPAIFLTTGDAQKVSRTFTQLLRKETIVDHVNL